MIAMGRVWCGVMFFAAGELFGVGILARLYVLCRPALHRLEWFVRCEDTVRRCSAWAHGLFSHMPLWQRARRLIFRMVHKSEPVRRPSGEHRMRG
jgi:hypothetical protein